MQIARRVSTHLHKGERITLIILSTLRVIAGLIDVLAILVLGLFLSLTTDQSKFADVESFILRNFSFEVNYEVFILALASFTLVLFLAKSIFSTYIARRISRVIGSIETRVTRETLSNLIDLRLQNYSVFSSHEYQNALVLSAASAFTYLVTYTITAIAEIFLLICITTLFLFVDPFVTLLLVIYFGAVGLLLQRKLGSSLQKNGAELNESIIESQSRVSDILSIRSEITFLNRQESFLRYFELSRSKVSASNSNVMYLSLLPRYIIEAAMLIGVALMAIFILASGGDGNTFTTVGIFLAGSLRIVASVLPLQSALGSIKQHNRQADYFFQVSEGSKASHVETGLDEEHESASISENASASRVRKIQIDNLTKQFDLTLQPSLKDVSCELELPSFVAIIGNSGAGKSTFIKIILGLETQTAGSIAFIGSKGEQISRQDVKFGYVPQAPTLIHGTLLSNILLNPFADNSAQNRVREVLFQTRLIDMVDSLSDGLMTEISPQANNFSGGQIQRIGIARALIADPDILILDEATSALDAMTESEISDVLVELSKSKLIVAIAHRLSTVEHASNVLFLKDGALEAEGTLRELAINEPNVSNYIELLRITSQDT